jgi:signal transduction histidine kinase
MNKRNCIVEDTDSERIFSVSISQVKTKEDSAGYVLLIKDITAMKAKEVEDNRNKRLIAMGEMMASIVHELRNPLCSIELYSSMLYRELKGTPYESIARGVSGGVQNLNNFLSNMLYFAKPRIPKKVHFRIDTLVEETLSMITPVIQTRNIVVEQTVDPFYVEGDSGLIKQAIMNILLNAVQAMDSEGVIKIYTNLEEGFLRLNIEDSGRGIDRSIIDRVFDPFFSTKDEGTGLGLSISLRIMQSHGGSISIRSVTGKGTVFSLQFPERLITKGVDNYVSNTHCR